MTRRLTIKTECKSLIDAMQEAVWIAQIDGRDKPVGYGPTEGDAVHSLYAEIGEIEQEDEIAEKFQRWIDGD